MEKIRLMTGTVAPNEYGNCKGRGSYETSLPGLIQLRTSERQCCSEAKALPGNWREVFRIGSLCCVISCHLEGCAQQKIHM